jgi:hypothetical protein
MRLNSVFWQGLAWVVLWGFWVIVSKDNHPSFRLNAIATGFLAATFAAAVHANHLRLIPRFWNQGRYAAYTLALLLVMGTLALACTLAIHLVYDFLQGPDPLRFGFWANYAMEFVGVAIHVAAVAGGVWLATLLRNRPALPVPSATLSEAPGD